MATTTLTDPTTTFSSPLLELDERANSGLRVTLAWQPIGNRLVVDVHDGDHRALTILGIPPEDANLAFHHPFAYARPGVDVCEYLPMPRLYEDADLPDTIGDDVAFAA